MKVPRPAFHNLGKVEVLHPRFPNLGKEEVKVPRPPIPILEVEVPKRGIFSQPFHNKKQEEGSAIFWEGP